jgi:hypothetical protein
MDERTAVSRIDYYTEGLLVAAKNSDSGGEITWVIVESDDDCEVYGKFLVDDENVKLRDSGCKENGRIKKGWARVERLVSEFEDSLTIIGIRDRDYTLFVEDCAVTSNVLMTDCRDLEMMMISAGVLTRIIPPQVRGRSLDDILKTVYEHTRKLGYLRIINDVRNLSCSFRNFLKMSIVWDQTTHTYLPDCLSNITVGFIENSKQPGSELDIDNFVAEKRLDGYSIYDVCRGHDVIDQLAWNLIGNEYSRKILETKMRNAYSLADFYGTHLYSKIKEWERNTGRRVFK